METVRTAPAGSSRRTAPSSTGSCCAVFSITSVSARFLGLPSCFQNHLLSIPGQAVQSYHQTFSISETLMPSTPHSPPPEEENLRRESCRYGRCWSRRILDAQNSDALCHVLPGGCRQPHADPHMMRSLIGGGIRVKGSPQKRQADGILPSAETVLQSLITITARSPDGAFWPMKPVHGTSCASGLRSFTPKGTAQR